MILSARDLKVRGVLCALRFVHVVDFSMSHGGRGECGMPTAPGLSLSVTLTGVQCYRCLGRCRPRVSIDKT